MIAPLFTELGIMPLRFRRLILALRYLSYIITRPPDDYIHAAMRDSFDLYLNGHPGWFGDLFLALHNLPTPILLPQLTELNAARIEILIKEVKGCSARWLQEQITQSPKLYLLHGRMEPQGTGPAREIISWFRHYLDLPIAKHRIALTRLLLSDHCLAIERLRWADRYHPFVPRDQRFCRFCKTEVETVEHALFFCVASGDLVVLRAELMQNLRVVWPGCWILPVNAVRCLQTLVFRHDTLPLLAKYAYDVLQLFSVVVLPRPSLPNVSDI